MAAQIWPSEEPTCHQLRSNDKLRGMGGCASELQRSRSLRRMATGGGSSTLATPDDLEGGELHLGRFATLTAIYALVEGALSHPYELIKTRQQAGAPSSLGRRMGTMPYMLHLVRTGGVRELYRGFGWSVIGGIPSEVIYYVGYTECKRMLLSTSAGAASPSAVFLAAGALADALSVMVSVPADVVSQRLQLQGVDSGGLRERSGVQVALDIMRREGPFGLWRGTGATLAFFAPNGAVWWTTHEHAKAALSGRSLGGEPRARGSAPADPEPSSAVLVASGALAGVAATLVSNPLDVVKTRLQTSPCRSASPPCCAQSSTRAAGAGCTAGWCPGCLPSCLAQSARCSRTSAPLSSAAKRSYAGHGAAAPRDGGL